MILIINCGSSKCIHIEEMVDEFVDFETKNLDDFSETIHLTENIQGVIISGAPILITEVDPTPYLEKFLWLKETKLPVLGICFGHQILGMTFGAYANRQKDDRDFQTIELINESVLFEKFPEEFEMLEDHCECISLPKDFLHLCVSDACVNEGMQHKEKALFGVQFHPEVSGNMGRLLFDNFIKICSKSVTS